MALQSSTKLGGVAETLFMPLYIRAMESERQDALIKDDIFHYRLGGATR